MARSQNAARNHRLYILIPVVALIFVTVIFVLATLPASSAPPKVSFIDQMVILVENNFGNQTQEIFPKAPIGLAGGIWATTQYNGYGIDRQHYPLYMDPAVDCTHANATACVIHVQSTVNHNFTLGDFFNVWGQTLGQNNTVGFQRLTNKYGTFAWELCTGPTGNGLPYLSGPFSGLVLQPELDITLIFYNTSNGVGCA